MTKKELEKQLQYFRAFARQTRDIVKTGASHKEKVIAIQKNILVYENQWPNWLDER